MKFDMGVVSGRFKKRWKLSCSRPVKLRDLEIKMPKAASRAPTPTYNEKHSTEIARVSSNATNLRAYLNFEMSKFDTWTVERRRKMHEAGLKLTCQISVLET